MTAARALQLIGHAAPAEPIYAARDSFVKLVAPASRLSIERLLASDDLTLVEARVGLAELHQLTTWSRMSWDTYRDYLLELAQVDQRHGRRALAANDARGAVGWRSARGRGRRSTIWLPGGDGRRPIVVVEKGAGGALFSAEKGAGGGQKRGRVAPPQREGDRENPLPLFKPDGSGLHCFIDNCPQPVVSMWAGQWWCAGHLEEQLA